MAQGVRLVRGITEPGPERDAALAAAAPEPGPAAPRPQERAYGLRVTAMRALEQCPDMWAHSYVRGAQRTSSRSSRIGDAVHATLERALKGRSDLADSVDWGREQAWLRGEGVPPAEVVNMVDYYSATLVPLGRPLAVECEFEEEAWPGGPMIVGHVDCVFPYLDGEAVLLVDHKTDRRDLKGAAEWAQDIQPLGYSWYARRRWPELRVFYRVGYVNMGRVVEWEVPESAYAEFIGRVARNVGAIAEHTARGSWPRTAGAGCRFCPLKDGCPEASREGDALLGALTGGDPPALRG